MSIAVDTRTFSQGPVNQNLRLKAVEVPTIIVLSGLLGSGKTSLAETIFSFNETPPELRAMLFNEKNLSLAQSDAARIPDSIRKTTLDGCACCSSNAKLIEAVGQFLAEGKRLVLIEQSGVTDGGQLRATLEDKLGQKARVRLISVVDSEHLDAPPSVLHSSVLAADAVVASHVTEASRLAKARNFLGQLTGKDFDFVQGRAGDFEADLWDRLNSRKAEASSGGLPLFTSSLPKDSPEYRKERAKLLRSTQSVAIVLYPDLSRADLAECLSKSPVLIDRAKGYTSNGGTWSSVQYELKDENKAALCINQTEEKPTLFGGRPHLLILSTHGSPPAEHFLDIGTPDFSEKAVEYYINLYPDYETMQRMLVSNGGVPARSDGDMLFMSAHRLLENIEKIPDSRIEEFESGFVALLDKFVSWRLEALELLSKEHRVDKGIDTAERQVTLGYALSWTLNKFGGLLQNTDVFGDLFERLLKARPANVLYQGLARMSRFEIDGEEELLDSHVNDVALFAAQGRQFEGLGLPDVNAAISNLEKISLKSSHPSVNEKLPRLKKNILDQFE